MTPLTDHDHQMIRHATARGQVVVTVGERLKLATLISWRPHHHGRRTRTARVQYPRGTFASVRIENVRLP